MDLPLVNFDIDIDVADRQKVLQLLPHVPASIWRDGTLAPHTTGIYVCDIPRDPITGLASLDYQLAEQLGYLKIDVLNNSVYQLIQSPQHLDQLLATEPPWHRLSDKYFVQDIVHIGRHWRSLCAMPEPVNSIPRMAMFLAMIRPGKRHLLGQSWDQVAQEIWQPTSDGSYVFKASHSFGYAVLVGIHMILTDQMSGTAS